MNLFTIPPGGSFLDTLATWWLAQSGPDPLAAADGMILLPTRRAARSLTAAFLRVTAGRPFLLPRIVALGALDEAPLALAGTLDLPPAVEPMRRLAVLTRMVMAMGGADGAPAQADGAWLLATELASLLDEAHRAEVDLAAVLPAAVEAGYAAHWVRTVDFLAVVTDAWPRWLRENGLMDAASRATALLKAQADTWQDRPPGHRVLVAGTTGGIPAVAALMRVVLRLEQGAVILPGLDQDMPDAAWQALDEGHPQAGLRALLAGMGAARTDAAVLGAAGPRATTLWRALLPAAALAAWREPFQPDIAGIHRLEPADQQEEAVAVALALRAALEVPGAQAALVTPDRALAIRVAAEMARYAIVVDDSAGEALADTPPAVFLRLLARAVADGLSPVALLSVLKHPLAALGLSPAACRRAARALERACLRGPAPPPGLPGLRMALDRAALRLPGMAAPRGPQPAALDLLDRLEARLAPLLAIAARHDATPSDALLALVATAEAMAATDTEDGAARLWAYEEGDALATHLAALGAALPVLPAQHVATLPGLLEASMQGAVVRSRRALRGRDGAEHPRVAILGLLEARLQSFDTVVLGGLAETVWPQATDPGPWMSRPMRKAAGLMAPEERVGQAAHDFVLTACAARIALLSCPRRRDGAPAVPARWLVRLEAFLAGHGTVLPHHPAAAWAQQLDQPGATPTPAPPPQPRPPVSARPRRLSVTEIETWLRDPYAIYAKHVLALRALDPLEQTADAADYGTIVHAAIAAFIAALPATYPADAPRRLRAEMARALADQALRPALAAWWRPRLDRIANWVADMERLRRLPGPPPVRVEVEGAWAVPTNGLPFTLKGRADRLERRDAGLTVLDYKTGTLPSAKQVEHGLAPQLLLEAAMAASGVWGPDWAAPAAELAYWHLTGGFFPGEVHDPFRKVADIPAEVAAAERSLVALVGAFDDPATPYLSQPNPDHKPRFSDYAQLARVAEWAALEDDA